jgi:hypothetical protein
MSSLPLGFEQVLGSGEAVDSSHAATAGGGGDEDGQGSDPDDDDEEDDRRDAEAARQAGVDGAVTYGANECSLVWQGIVPKRAFTGFKFQECRSSSVARKLLDTKSLAHYWDAAMATAAAGKSSSAVGRPVM